jgi:hypothetical protein
MGLLRTDPQRLTAGGHAFDAITLRCRRCNMSRREWDQSKGKARCIEVERELNGARHKRDRSKNYIWHLSKSNQLAHRWIWATCVSSACIDC